MEGRIQPLAEVRTAEMPESESVSKGIVIYICPTDSCSNYYAAPDFAPSRADLEAMQYHRNQNTGEMVASHSRIECPSCRGRGLRVDRVPYVVTQVISLDKMMEFVKRVRSGAGTK